MHHHALSVVNVCRYKVLAQQYKAMYPTLEIDIKGELAKLKVGTNCLKNTLYLCLYNNISHVFRTMWRGSILVEGANAALLDIDFGEYSILNYQKI